VLKDLQESRDPQELKEQQEQVLKVPQELREQ
jgi:hypothetical protein